MKKLTFILSITLTLSAFAQVPSYVPTNGLVGWWPFNGNANDESGNGNNGTSSNGASYTVDRNGLPNSSMLFPGLLNLPVAMQFTNNEWSFSLWVRKDANLGHNPIQLSEMNGWAAASFGFTSLNGNLNSNGQPRIYAGSGGTSCGLLGTASNCTALNAQWTHVTYTFSNNIISIYTNGILCSNFSSTSGNWPCINPNMALWIGGDVYGGAVEYYTGTADDIGIWNRALTNQEVAALYNGCQQSILTQPQSQTASLNDNVQFTAASSDPNATYQWQTNVGLGFQNLSDAGQYAGTSMNTLNVSNVGALNVNQEFRCVIQSGTCTDTTDVATLKVCGSILAQPNNESVLLNANVQFTAASSDPNTTYQWQTNVGLGFQNLTDAGQYSGSVTNTLNVSNVTLSNNNQQFRCIIASGSCSDTSDVALLSVNDNLSISENSETLVQVYPNPAKETITISSDASIVGKDFSIINQLGQVVILDKISHQEMSIDLSDLSTGVYVIRIDGVEKSSFRIVKE